MMDCQPQGSCSTAVSRNGQAEGQNIGIVHVIVVIVLGLKLFNIVVGTSSNTYIWELLIFYQNPCRNKNR